MPKILVIGLVPPSGMGDLLQYHIAIELLKKHVPGSDMLFSIPACHSNLLATLSGVQVRPSLGEVTTVKYIVKSITGLVPELKQGSCHRRQSSRCGPSTDATGIISRKFYESSFRIRYVQPAIARVMFADSISAGAIGGHTIEAPGFFDYVSNYVSSRAVVKGPLITFPISVSMMALREHRKRQNLLKHSLKCLNLIFVRGPYSYRLLAPYVEEQRIRIAPDSGLGIRLLYGPPRNNRRKGPTRIAIIPRKDYFVFYHKPDLYSSYVDVLVKVIRRLTHGSGIEVYILPHALKEENPSRLDDEVAICDLLSLLNTEKTSKTLKIFRPKSPMDTYRLFSSMDLVVTSRMHGGVIAMAAGSPALFLLPSEDIKVLDVLSLLHLDEKDFTIDIFNSNELKLDNIMRKIMTMLDNNIEFKKMVTRSVERTQRDVDLPARVLARMMR